MELAPHAFGLLNALPVTVTVGSPPPDLHCADPSGAVTSSQCAWSCACEQGSVPVGSA